MPRFSASAGRGTTRAFGYVPTRTASARPRPSHRLGLLPPPLAEEGWGGPDVRLDAEIATFRARHERLRGLIFNLKLYHALRQKAALQNSQRLRRDADRVLAHCYARFFGEEKAGFNPDQPRVPAGNPDGGQWIGTGGQGAARVRLAQTDRLAGYPVDLRDEEARGGHTIEKHVNKPREALVAQVRNAFLQDERAFDSRAGSFSSLEAATKLVNSTLSQNRAIVDLVASGVRPREVVISRFGSVTGFEAVMPTARSQPFFRETYGVGAVIVHDRSSPRGYRVHTAFPTNR
jgi:CDI toxin RNase A-like protein